MTYIVVLFNLASDADLAKYEAWARATDLPTVNGLKSVDAFDVFKANGVLGSDAPPPFQYVEIIAVNDMQTFGEEVGTETMQKVAGEFRAFADAPVFMLTQKL
ncbi:MAG: REDY-like protein HapK [Pseudomonadota bacterium]